MIEEQAIVVEVSADEVVVQTQRKSSCNSCAAKKGCGTAVLASSMGQKHSIVSIPKPSTESPSLMPGDQVVIGINEGMLMSGSALVYVLPLAGMFGLAALSLWAGQKIGLVGELHVVIASLAGLFVGIAFSRYYLTKSTNSVEFAPVLIRKLQQVTPVRDNILLP